MSDIKRFTELDWAAYAGAQKFQDGTDPFFYERVLNDGLFGLNIIADAEGLEIVLFGTGMPEPITFIKEYPLRHALVAEGELKHLIAHLQNLTEACEVAYELNHPSDKVTIGFAMY